MNCLICKTDITNPLQQFGDTRCPVCQSCWLADCSWVQDDPELVDELQHGATLDEALLTWQAKRMKEIQFSFQDLAEELANH